MNIRTCDDLPVPLTSKMAHHFMAAPESYSVNGAFRWGQISALGGSRRLADVICGTRLVREFQDDPFWLSVFRFFANNPLLDPAHISPIIDYIWTKRFEPRLVFSEAGVASEVGPEEPNFSMRGRTAKSLLVAVERWHQQLGKESAGHGLAWPSCRVEEFTFIEGRREEKNMKAWTIRELMSSRELVAEGRYLQHCVASYAQSCHQRRCSIWSLSMQEGSEAEKLLTIELDHVGKLIRQVRGKRNRMPTIKEKEIVKRWAEREKFKIEGESAGN